MQRTLLVGKAVVFAKIFCDNWRRPVAVGEGAKKRKVAFPKKVWEEVMAAAFQQFPVGRLVDVGTNRSRVIFSAPPLVGRDRKVYYHNLLMDMFGISARHFSSVLARAPDAVASGGQHIDESFATGGSLAVGVPIDARGSSDGVAPGPWRSVADPSMPNPEDSDVSMEGHIDTSLGSTPLRHRLSN